MKKWFLYIGLALFIGATFTCGNSIAETKEELKQKLEQWNRKEETIGKKEDIRRGIEFQIMKKRDRLSDIEREIRELGFKWGPFLGWNCCLGTFVTPIITFPIWYLVSHKPMQDRKKTLEMEQSHLRTEISNLELKLLQN